MSDRFSWKHGLLLGCGCLTVAAVVGIVVVVLFFAHVGTDPVDVTVSVEAPTEVTVGQSFRLDVQVHNGRRKKDFHLGDIDISTEYLDHFVVLATDPEPKSTEDNAPFEASRSFTYKVTIPAGDTRVFAYELRAETPGLHRGDLDVCEGLQFLTTMLQTSVREELDEE